ncbi:MAG: hypothetical protein ABI566_10820 [Pseudolysinimonas sp.]
MVKVITQSLAVITGRKIAVKRSPRHRIGRYAPSVRTHPWFELRAERTAELGQYR